MVKDPGSASNDASDAKATRPVGSRRVERRARRLAVWGVVAAVVLVVLAGSVVYTDQSSFCPTCHEMQPYYQAWLAGGHATSARCIDCHVDPGILADLAHKPVALKEVWDHFFATVRFPTPTVDVPNSRCVRCHATITDKPGAAFSHATHAKYVICKECHPQVGHTVTMASLAAAGVLSTSATTPAILASGTAVTTGTPASSAAGHITVVCQDCHDLSKMKCSACHQPLHEYLGECSNCHRPGTAFTFAHPAGTNCAACHTPPANHFGTDCSACHTPGVPFASAVFVHPQTHHDYRSRPCATCHPNGYATAYCTCHHGNPPGGD
jgi:nitrate/TMAO reductase-like tetraheme cytochrome c subunit